MGTPRSAGFRMPAEWAPHLATWISWPHNRETWPGKFEMVEPVMVDVVKELAGSEPVYVNVLDADHEAHVRSLFDPLPADVRFFHIPTNDAWCRDHGATFLVGSMDVLACADWTYNAWGGKYPPYDLDDRAAAHMADAVGARRFRAEFVLEGGAVDVNGAGAVMTTASCVLNPNRNPAWTAKKAERRLGEWLGVDHVLWVEGDLEGDDTDGHVDNLARFVSSTDIVMVLPDDPRDVHFRPLKEAFSRLEDDAEALGIRVHPLPLPRPIVYRDRRLPASYANFYVGNSVVLLPAYGGSEDAEAARILSSFFPGRRVVPLDCSDLVWGLGAFHCLTQQVPDPVPRAIPAI